VVTAFRPQAGDVFVDVGKETGIVTGVGAELSGVLVAGLAPTSTLFGQPYTLRSAPRAGGVGG